MLNAWSIYSGASLFLLLVLYYVSRHWLKAVTRLFILFGLGLFLAIPYGVPGVNSLAPAWMIAVFEFVFGSKVLASAAIKPVGFVLGFYGLLALVFLLWRIRNNRSAR